VHYTVILFSWNCYNGPIKAKKIVNCFCSIKYHFFIIVILEECSFDAFVFVTPEYNHGIPDAPKNAIGFLSKEWNYKVAAFVSYGGSVLGTRAMEHLHLVMAELEVQQCVTRSPFLSLQTSRTLQITLFTAPIFNRQIPASDTTK
jgi:hypothetical protein